MVKVKRPTTTRATLRAKMVEGRERDDEREEEKKRRGQRTNKEEKNKQTNQSYAYDHQIQRSRRQEQKKKDNTKNEQKRQIQSHSVLWADGDRTQNPEPKTFVWLTPCDRCVVAAPEISLFPHYHIPILAIYLTYDGCLFCLFDII